MFGNLGVQASHDSVQALFTPFGAVGRVTIVSDRVNGDGRGYGFVEMRNLVECDKAIRAVNATECDGHTLHVNHASPHGDHAPDGMMLDGLALSVKGTEMRVAVRGFDDAAIFRFRDGTWIAEDGLRASVSFNSPFDDKVFDFDLWAETGSSLARAAVSVCLDADSTVASSCNHYFG